jgi:hypothetical protein
MFPYHRVPDGSVFVPHHLIWALLGALVPLAMVWDNHPTKEPVYAVMAVLVALVAFVLVWPTHHVLGAALAVAATVAAVLVLAVRLRVQCGRPCPWQSRLCSQSSPSTTCYSTRSAGERPWTQSGSTTCGRGSPRTDALDRFTADRLAGHPALPAGHSARS